jgi:hypothetical protein
MTGYCGRCRVHFTTLGEWEDHQHGPWLYWCSCGHSYAELRAFNNHLDNSDLSHRQVAA